MSPAPTAHSEDGFSLLETLFALAIMSLASLALFQSTGTMLQLSERAVKAGERTLNSGLDRKALSNLIDGIVPQWPEQESTAFIGRAKSLSGVSAGALTVVDGKPTAFALSLEANERGQSSLIYRAGEEREDGAGWALLSTLPEDARLSYMGEDHSWYEKWPPDTVPSRGYFNDAAFVTRPPATPLAVRISDGERVLFTSRISRAAQLPPRLNEAEGL